VRTALIHHPSSALHRMQPGHPEAPARLSAVLDRIRVSGLAGMLEIVTDTRAASDAEIQRAHAPALLAQLQALTPRSGLVAVDPDTALCPDSLTAARHAAGAAITAVEGIEAGRFTRAFCALRPPGHHAERDSAMGFCLLNSIAVAALHALEACGFARLAILDFDVHHGNGTVDIFRDDPRVLVCSSFQSPFYPDRMTDLVRDHLVFTPLPAGTGSDDFRRAIDRDWLPALERHRPELILVSAGFDAHEADPLAGLRLKTEDFTWVTQRILDAAQDRAAGRILSLLEGGYELEALAASALAHVSTLAEA
jgi:acetoin utilization deacetylase AcuC-like enzyme